MSKRKVKLSQWLLYGGGKEKTYFAENLSMLVSAGITPSTALGIIASSAKSGNYKKLLLFMQARVDEGSTLWSVLTESKILPENMINLIRIGEKSGRLTENLQLVVMQSQKDRSFKSKVKSAMLYPTIVLVTSVFVGISVSWFILPKLSNVFTNMGAEVPLPTKILIAMGDFIGKYGSIGVPALFVAIILMIALFTTVPFFKKIGRSFLFSIPKVKQLMIEVEVARMGFIVGTLINTGLSLVDALDLLSTTTQNEKYRKLYASVKNSVEDGMPFMKAIEAYKKSKKLIPNNVQQMIMAGEQSGRLPEIMTTINGIYEEKVDTTAKNLSVILEPILLVVVWFGVLFIAVSVIMPIYSLIGSMQS
jgi:type IV pilus assembly protein PilC